MTTVIGLDLSLTATGVAVVAHTGMFRTTTIPSKGSRDDRLVDRAARIEQIVNAIADYGENWAPALVVLEGPSVMSKGGSNWDRAWLWGAVVDMLLPVPVAVCPPTVLKKWAAGKGNADKAAVAVGVARLWDQFECESDNEADALGLASMGAQRLGLTVVPVRAHHRAALDKVEWPASMPLSAGDLAAIDEDTRAERTQDAADRGEGQ